MDITMNIRVNLDGAQTHYYIKPSYQSWGVYRDDVERAATTTVGYTKRNRTTAGYLRAAMELVIKDLEQRGDLLPSPATTAGRGEG